MSRCRLLVLVIVLPGLIGASVLAWLLGSAGGRDWALGRLLAQLPAGALSVERAEGTLAGPLRLHGVRYQAQGFELTVGELRLDHRLGPLLRGRLQVDALALADVRVRIIEDAPTPSAPPLALPEALPWPAWSPPFAIALPSVVIERVRIERVDAEPVVLARITTGGQIDRSSRLQLDRLRVEAETGRLDGQGWLRMDGRPELGLELAWTAVQLPERSATLRLAGEGETLTGELALGGEAELRVEIETDWRWRLQLDARQFDPAIWRGEPAGDPFGAALRAHGDRDGAEIEGELTAGELRLRLLPSRLEVAEGGAALRLAPLRLAPGSGGEVEVRGLVGLGELTELALELNLSELVATAGDADLPVRLDGQATVRGQLGQLQVAARGQLRAAEQSAQFELDATLDPDGADLAMLRLRQQQGWLEVDGRLDWSPQLRWQLAGRWKDFDPAVLAPEWPGRLDGELRVEGARDDDGVRLRLQLVSLSGSLRGRRVQGQGEFGWGFDDARATLALRIGESRLRLEGRPVEPLDLRLQMAPLLLADVLPEAGGRFEGELRITGDPRAPQIGGELQGSGLALAAVAADHLSLSGDGTASGPSRLQLQAAGVRLGDQVFESLTAIAAGTQTAHTLRLGLVSPALTLHLDAAGGGDLDGWSGRMQGIELGLPALESHPQWRLPAPVALRWRPPHVLLEPACLQAEAARACVRADAEGEMQRLTLELAGLPLALLEPWLPEDSGVRLHGLVEGAATVRLRAGALVGADAELRLPAGRLDTGAATARQLLSWQGLVLAGALDAGRLTARIEGRLDDDGRIDGEFAADSPLAAADGVLQGRLALFLPRLLILEPLLPELVAPDGRLRGELEVGGRWSAPQLHGRIALEALAGELPALGLRLRDSTLSLRGDGERLEIEGALDTGEGLLRAEGHLTVFEAMPRLQLRLVGERVRAADTRFVRALVSPDLQVLLERGQLRIDGKVAIPEAALELEQLEASVASSRDVVVLDPHPGDAVGPAVPRRVAVEVSLGERVTLKGFGFDGGISGDLRVAERPGQAATGRGTLTVRGRYRAYGQDLDIERGRLLFASTPLDDPALDVRARRRINGQTVGIEVRGSALRPRLAVWSDPVLDQAEALSYLMLGRPLRSATSAEGAQLGQAAAALGGNLLAERVGARLGLDTFEVADSQALGGAALTVGKYLSPSLYLGYGISLFGAGQVVIVRYLLTDKIDLEVESGAESRAGINYRLER